VEEQLRPIRKNERAFLTRELEHWRELNLLDERQVSAISALYEPAKERFLKVLMGLGAMLVGLGVLSYIAANWMDLSRVLKVTLIVGVYFLSIMAAYGFNPSYPHTSRAFLLIGSFIYGGGIFLIAQIFHEGGTIADALFWWMVGLAPVCLLFKDRMQLLLIQVIALIYFHLLYDIWRIFVYSVSPNTLSQFLLSLFSTYPLIVFAGLWILWWFIANQPTGARSRNGLHLNIFVTLNFIFIHASRCWGDGVMVYLLFFAIGLFLCAAPLGRLKDALEGWGIALTGVFSLILSIQYFWRWSMLDDYSVVVAILACAMLLWHIYKGSLLATVFFCLLILRYYFSIFYDFLDKALFFTIGGVLLMAMGFYLQRIRNINKQPKSAEQVIGSWQDQ